MNVPKITSKHGFVTTAARSQMMRRIKSKDTTPEIKLRSALWSKGLRYRKDYKLLPGKPDIVLVKNKIAIFVDGEFWHGFNWEKRKTTIKDNREYWIQKIEKNIDRDKKYNFELEQKGWKVIRFWDREVNTNLEKCINTIRAFL
jgi:DNA mismatch endonuclease (patch repair protein)